MDQGTVMSSEMRLIGTEGKTQRKRKRNKILNVT
jgi:hypothetical protein